jgi:hypothetical protein
MKPFPACLLAAALLAPAGAALAQTIYKYERPDGGLVYSDKPVKGARLVERFTIAQAPAAAPGPQAAPRPQAQAPEQPLSEVPSANPPSALDAADAQVRAAQKSVEDAKARAQQGAEPLAGERVGTGGGKSRLTEEYFVRQKQLEQELAVANARLEEAYRRRSDAK